MNGEKCMKDKYLSPRTIVVLSDRIYKDLHKALKKAYKLTKENENNEFDLGVNKWFVDRCFNNETHEFVGFIVNPENMH